MTDLILTGDNESVGVIYDDSMAKHYCIWDPNYPECPERILEIQKRCEELNLLIRCKRLTSQKATLDELLKKHSREIILLLEECVNKTETELEEISSRFDSVYICSETFNSALLAAGSTVRLVQAICEGEVRNGMAIVRPPGHHAMTSEFCGYCFFNNVALAADYALEHFNLSRILIVDWDVHHGQATQQMFYNDPRVLYFSIHRYDHGTFWPNLRESNCDFIGEGAGRGYNFNVPLNKAGYGNADYLTIFNQLLLPIAAEYQPELIIVSSGYDAALGCPEFEPEIILISGGYDSCLGDEKGEMKVTPACYSHFVNALKVFARGRIAIVLEGGYCLKSLAEGAALTLRALLGDPCPDLGAVGAIDESIRETILNVIYHHRPYWKCFQRFDIEVPSEIQAHVTKLDFYNEQEGRFETRNCYPIQETEIISKYTALLSNLIKNTNLHVPEFRCVFLSNPSSYDVNQSFFQDTNVKIIAIDENCSAEQNINKAVDFLLKNSARAVIIDEVALNLNEKQLDVAEIVLNNVINDSNPKRILLINFHSKDGVSEAVSNNNDVLRISFGNENFLETKSSVNHKISQKNIEIVWNNQIVGDSEYTAAWLQIVLPVSYQFSPEIIIVVLNLQHSVNNISAELYGYLIHWLTSLANGKIILLPCFNNKNDFQNNSFISCYRALLGSPLSMLKMNDTTCASANNVLKKLCQQHFHYWPNLNFF